MPIVLEPVDDRKCMSVHLKKSKSSRFAEKKINKFFFPKIILEVKESEFFYADCKFGFPTPENSINGATSVTI